MKCNWLAATNSPITYISTSFNNISNKTHSLSLNIGKSVLGDLDSIGVPGLALVGGGEAVGGRAAVQGESVTEVLVGSAEVDGDVVPAYLIPC